MNTPFTVYDESGTIIRTGSCPERDLQNQAGAGERVVPVKSRPGRHKVNLATSEIENKPTLGAPTFPGSVAVGERVVFAFSLPTHVAVKEKGENLFSSLIPAGDHAIIFDDPGEYTVEFVRENMLSTSLEVTVA